MGIRPSLAEDASDEAFAEAMVRCQMYAPDCSYAHECRMDGYCFGREGQGFAAARKAVRALVEAEDNVFTRSWLKVALDALEQEHFISGRTIDALRLISINKAVRRQYGAPTPPTGKGK